MTIYKFCVVCSFKWYWYFYLLPFPTHVNLKVWKYKAYKNNTKCMFGWLVDYTLHNCPHTKIWYFSSNFATKAIGIIQYKKIGWAFLQNRSTSYKRQIEIGKEVFFFFNLSLNCHWFLLVVCWGHWQNSTVSQYEFTHPSILSSAALHRWEAAVHLDPPGGWHECWFPTIINIYTIIQQPASVGHISNECVISSSLYA